MPSPVAANDLVPISGSVQTSRISYAVEPAGKNYGQNYNSTTWYSDIPNDSTRYTIVTDNYTANYYVSRSLAEGGYVEGGLPAVDEYSAPVFWQTVGTSSLDVITIVNGLPDRVGETPFNSGSQALNWVASSSNYFAVGPDYYRDIDADNLGLYLEGNQIISYPTTGSTWYDVSGYNSKFTLLNGLDAGWNSNGWFNFDGTDDYAESIGNINSVYSSSQVTTECLILFSGSLDSNDRKVFHYSKAGTTNGVLQLRKGNNNNDLLYQYNSGGTWYTLTLTGAIASANTWYHFMIVHDGTYVRAYRNGVLLAQSSFAASLDWTDADYLLLGLRAASEYWKGDIAKFRMYPASASLEDVQQNYYGGPIVTGSSLIYANDASNLVSYPKSGTAVYDLTPNGLNMTLYNGVAFEKQYGGYWDYDGTNDYSRATLVGFNPDAGCTLEMWTKRNSVPPAWRTYMNLKAQGANTPFIEFRTQAANTTVVGLYYDGTNYITSGYNTNVGEFYHLALTINPDGVMYLYVNGKEQGKSLTNFGPAIGPDPTLTVGMAYDNSRNTDISVGSIRIYNEVLTADQIAQNYNATN